MHCVHTFIYLTAGYFYLVIMRSGSKSTLPDRATRSSSEVDMSAITNIADLAAYIKKSNDKITSSFDKLSTSLNNKMDLLCKDMNTKITTLRSEINSRMDSIHSDLENKLLKIETEMSQRINYLERQSCSCDIIVAGIPYLSNENVSELIRKICSKIGIENPGISSVFRIKSSKQVSPIVIKFNNFESKKKVFKNYLNYNKLCLNDVDLNSENRIYMNDSLTKLDSIIMKRAAELRKLGLIHKVGVRNGYVVVKWTTESSFTKVSILELENKATLHS